jgi:predicted RNase H-like nuclease
MIAGADWFEGKWLAVVAAADGQTEVRQVCAFSDFLEWADLQLLVIDIPIGLPERGSRACEPLARQVVRPRASSVFPAPIRPVLNASTHEEACRILNTIDGKRCSIQAFSIYRIIAAVDSHMSPALQDRVREGHPELSFAYMNGGSGLKHSKHTPEGQRGRVALLEQHFPDLEACISALPQSRAAIDLLDAFSMLWTARRIISGQALSVPEVPEYDSRGLRMEMVA